MQSLFKRVSETSVLKPRLPFARLRRNSTYKVVIILNTSHMRIVFIISDITPCADKELKQVCEFTSQSFKVHIQYPQCACKITHALVSVLENIDPIITSSVHPPAPPTPSNCPLSPTTHAYHDTDSPHNPQRTPQNPSHPRSRRPPNPRQRRHGTRSPRA